jgi:hypothetical protein
VSVSMRSNRAGLLSCGVLACGLLVPTLWAAEPCAGFRWDVTQERTLFASQAQPLVAGHDSASAPQLQPGKLYELQLQPQEQVNFALPPTRNKSAEGAHAGVARLVIHTAGTYRVSLDQPFWSDVVAGSQMLTSKDFQGVPGCNAPHKIVEFDLPATGDLLLQISGASAAVLRLTLTRS